MSRYHCPHCEGEFKPKNIAENTPLPCPVCSDFYGGSDGLYRYMVLLPDFETGGTMEKPLEPWFDCPNCKKQFSVSLKRISGIPALVTKLVDIKTDQFFAITRCPSCEKHIVVSLVITASELSEEADAGRV